MIHADWAFGDPAALQAISLFHNSVIERTIPAPADVKPLTSGICEQSLQPEMPPCPPPRADTVRISKKPTPPVVAPLEPAPTEMATATQGPGLDPTRFEAPRSDLLPSVTKGKHPQGEHPCFSAAPTRAQLYDRMPRVPECTYKSEATFQTALYHLVRNGILDPSDPDDNLGLLASWHPDYDAIIRNVPALLQVDFLSFLTKG